MASERLAERGWGKLTQEVLPDNARGHRYAVEFAVEVDDPEAPGPPLLLRRRS